MATTYWDYIRVEPLLALQGGLEDDESALSNDEVLFITVHQVFELWFKLVLRELGALQGLFRQDPVPETSLSGAVRGLDRMAEILRVAVQHWAVVETLNTRDYLGFRDKLFPASGFQSAQMREIEILLGLEESERAGFGSTEVLDRALGGVTGASPAIERVRRRRAQKPTLREAVDGWLHRTPIRGSQPGDADDDAVVDGFLEAWVEALARSHERLVAHVREAASDAVDPGALARRYEGEIEAARAFCFAEDRRRRRIRAAVLFIEGYRELPLLAWPREVLGGLVRFEQAFVLWRQRHVRMVERVIGRRIGTGGSSGVDYLEETAARYRVFKDLWAARTLMLREDDLPPLDDVEPYAFRASFGD